MTEKNWFLVDGERMLLTEEEAEEYDEDGCDVVAESTLDECECLPDLPDGRINGGLGHVCRACRLRYKRWEDEEIPFD